MRKFILLYLLAFFHLPGNSQDRTPGIINDPDGYTNIRAGKGTNFEIIDKILTNEIFYYTDSIGENWLKVEITRCRCDEPHRKYKNISGYMHRSRISNIDELTKEQKGKLFASIFEKESQYYKKLIGASDRTSEDYRQHSMKYSIFHEYQFGGSLQAFGKYICDHKDRKSFELFLNIIELEDGSADEAPSFTLGAIFKCDPGWVFESMKNHLGLMNDLEWGIVGDKKSEKRYNELRTSIGLSETNFSLYYEE